MQCSRVKEETLDFYFSPTTEHHLALWQSQEWIREVPSRGHMPSASQSTPANVNERALSPDDSTIWWTEGQLGPDLLHHVHSMYQLQINKTHINMVNLQTFVVLDQLYWCMVYLSRKNVACFIPFYRILTLNQQS